MNTAQWQLMFFNSGTVWILLALVEACLFFSATAGMTLCCECGENRCTPISCVVFSPWSTYYRFDSKRYSYGICMMHVNCDPQFSICYTHDLYEVSYRQYYCTIIIGGISCRFRVLAHSFRKIPITYTGLYKRFFFSNLNLIRPYQNMLLLTGFTRVIWRDY